MGQCQSIFQSDLNSHSPPLNAKERNLRPLQLVHESANTNTTNNKRPKRLNLRGFNDFPARGLASPSEYTTGTTPETPSSAIKSLDDDERSESSSSMLAQIASLTKSLSQQYLTEEEEEYDEIDRVPDLTEPILVKSPSIRHTIQVVADFDEEFDEDVIPEEVDPDAPSDEEESFHRVTEEDNEIDNWEMEPGPLMIPKKKISTRQKSPTRPQSHIKLRNAKSTKPNSIVHHSPPSKSREAKTHRPTPTSVDPHTLSQFNKLKVQVKLMNHQAKIKRRASKFEDRYEDVQNYRVLHKEFENIQGMVKELKQPRLKRSKSFDLKDTNSWFFDFENLDEDDDDNDSVSVGSMSLLSAASMESQRRFFEAKSRARRRNSEPTVTTGPFIYSHSKAILAIEDMLKDSPVEVGESAREETSADEEREVSAKEKVFVDRLSKKKSPLEVKSKSSAILKRLKREKPHHRKVSSSNTKLSKTAVMQMSPEKKSLSLLLVKSKSSAILKRLKGEKPHHKNLSSSNAKLSKTTIMQMSPEEKSLSLLHVTDEMISSSLPWPTNADSGNNNHNPGSNTVEYKKEGGYAPTARSSQPGHSDYSVVTSRTNSQAAVPVEGNDYHVSRRRRQYASDLVILSLPRPSSPAGSVKSVGSSVSGLSFLTLPPTESDEGLIPTSFDDAPRWRVFSKEAVILANADKCIEKLNAASRESKSSEEELPGNETTPLNSIFSSTVEAGFSEDKESAKSMSIATMSKGKILKMAEGPSLSRLLVFREDVKNAIEAKRLDFEKEVANVPQNKV